MTQSVSATAGIAIMTDDAIQLFEVIQSALDSDGLQRVVLSRPAQRDTSTASRIDIRPVTLRQERSYQWSRQLGPQVVHENCDQQRTLTALKESIGKVYRHVHLTVQNRRWAARFSRRGKCRLFQENHSEETLSGDFDTQHNRNRQYLITDGRPVPFLVETGIMTPQGKVRSRYFRKFRQINRYIEFIADVIDHLPQDDTIRIVDFGCGKSYLTFATHYYFTHVARRRVSVTGLDRRRDVVNSCNTMVNSLGLSGIQFEQGDIAAFTPQGHVHLAVSLHACDTATDDALAQAIRWEAEVILAVPCCQHELNATVQSGQIPLLSRHGILQERFCSLATDAIRAALLEKAGYQTQVLEFIEMEHTARNLLIRSVRRPPAGAARQTGKWTQEMKRFCDTFETPVLHLQRRLQELECRSSLHDSSPNSR